MQTIDLTLGERALADLLDPATHERLPIHSGTRDDSLLKAADEADREVALPGQSDRFMAFLQDRSNEAEDTALAEIRKKRGCQPEAARKGDSSELPMDGTSG